MSRNHAVRLREQERSIMKQRTTENSVGLPVGRRDL